MFNTIIMIYFVFINIIGLIIMGLDKKYAQQRKRRIPEKTLWKISIIGGAFGATIGMNWFRHKTKHPNFKWGFPFLALVDLILFYFILHI